jgi:isoamylase
LPRPPILPGQPYPLGPTWDGEGVNFALFSAHAERVELCLFDPSGHDELQRITLPERTDEIWHGYLPEARPNLLYGYRVHVAATASARPAPTSPSTAATMPGRC